jgi:hypothetical protein
MASRPPIRYEYLINRIGELSPNLKLLQRRNNHGEEESGAKGGRFGPHWLVDVQGHSIDNILTMDSALVLRNWHLLERNIVSKAIIMIFEAGPWS